MSDESDNPARRALTESSADVWKRWSEDRERRELQRRINAEIEAREAANLPIYPRECAQQIAEDTRTVAPDWRHMRPTLGPAWGRLLKAQPELAPDLTRQREAAIRAVFDAAPRHLRESITDIRTLIDLALIAHEAAAYQIGYEAGRIAERTPYHRIEKPRHRRPQQNTEELRLTLANETADEDEATATGIWSKLQERHRSTHRHQDTSRTKGAK